MTPDMLGFQSKGEDMYDLIVSNLSVTLAGNTVIQDISFKVASNELLAIVGPNGGGKSTLLRAILHLVPSTGTIIWHKDTLRYMPPLDRITRKGLPPLTVGNFLGFKEHHHKHDTLLSKVGLDPSYNERYIETLSTGEFQRLMLAWTVCGSPSVVVLDEPTSGLDVEGEHRIFSYIKHLPHCTVIIATHHLHSALEFADHILCINTHQVCYGSKSEVSLETIKQLYTGVHHDN